MDAFSSDDRRLIGSTFGCDDALARVIAGSARHVFAPRGKRLYPIGDGEDTTMLLAGRAHDLAYGQDGAVVVAQVIGPGDLFGNLLSTPGKGDEGEVQAAVYSRCSQLSGSTLVRLMESYASVAMAVARQLSVRLETMRQRMVETVLLSATGRICAELARQGAASPEATISPTPVFSEFAVIAQTTRETVSRTISQLEKRGIVERVEDGLHIVAPQRLRDMIR